MREYHEAAMLFPMMSKDDLDALAGDIREHGLQEPIELVGEKIIDGRNRYRACLMAKVKPDFIGVPVKDPIAYVLSKNLHRRHLTTGQRAMVAAKARELFDKQAKERQKLSEGRGKKKVSKDLLPLKGQARDQAGKALGVSGVSVDKATKILKHNPKLAKQVAAGKITLETATRRLHKKPEPEDDDRMDTLIHQIDRQSQQLQFSIGVFKTNLRDNHAEAIVPGATIGLMLVMLKKLQKDLTEFFGFLESLGLPDDQSRDVLKTHTAKPKLSKRSDKADVIDTEFVERDD
jgi:ParB-like chromosome segregation protein Spo0J